MRISTICVHLTSFWGIESAQLHRIQANGGAGNKVPTIFQSLPGEQQIRVKSLYERWLGGVGDANFFWSPSGTSVTVLELAGWGLTRECSRLWQAHMHCYFSGHDGISYPERETMFGTSSSYLLKVSALHIHWVLFRCTLHCVKSWGWWFEAPGSTPFYFAPKTGGWIGSTITSRLVIST